MKRAAYSLAYLCHAVASGVLYATNRTWLAVFIELISRGLLWVSE